MARWREKRRSGTASSLDKTQGAETSREKLFSLLILLSFLYFAARLVYFAVHVAHGIPPDEDFHYGLCRVYTGALLLPGSGDADPAFGPATHIPYLYYFLMGKMLSLNVFPLSDLVFLRLVNGLLALLTVYTGYRWIRLMTPNPLVHLFFVVLLTNTPMFSFLAAAVSYDNLTNLLAVSTLFFFHAYLKKKDSEALLCFFISLMAGTLTKKTFFPLVPVFVLLLLFHERKNLRALARAIVPGTGTFSKRRFGFTALAALLLVLNGTLYMGNYARYGTLFPGASQILGKEEAMKFRIHARDSVTSRYRAGKISFEDALEQARAIPHPGDRMDALYLLERARRYKEQPYPLMNRLEYVGTWLTIVLNRTVGIFAHQSLRKYGHPFTVYIGIYLFALILLIPTWRPSDGEGMTTDALVLFFFYAVVLMQFVNYPIYLQSLTVGKTVHGRYLFPVIVPFYGIMSFYMLKPFGRKIQLGLVAVVSLYFIWGDFPYFLMNAGPQWFAQGAGPL